MSRPLTELWPVIRSAGSSSVAGVPRGTDTHLADEVATRRDDGDEACEPEERADQEEPEVEQGYDAADDGELPVLPLDCHDSAQDCKRLRVDDREDEKRIRRQIACGHVLNRGDVRGRQRLREDQVRAHHPQQAGDDEEGASDDGPGGPGGDLRPRPREGLLRRRTEFLGSRYPGRGRLVSRRGRSLGLRRPHELDRGRALPSLLFLVGRIAGHGQLRQYAGLLNHTAFADAALSEASLPGSEAFLMEAHEVTDLLEARRRRGEAYLEFLRVASMSCGLYELARGGEHKQSAHAEDEVYYVVRGRARIRVRGEDREVRPGSVVFVPARAEHRFHDILENLAALVFFAPPEGTSPR